MFALIGLIIINIILGILTYVSIMDDRKDVLGYITWIVLFISFLIAALFWNY
jgi:hypothetical protein